MGLGFFIAKILLEQTGGTVKAINPAGGGARVGSRLDTRRDRRNQPPSQAEGDRGQISVQTAAQ